MGANHGMCAVIEAEIHRGLEAAYAQTMPHPEPEPWSFCREWRACGRGRRPAKHRIVGPITSLKFAGMLILAMHDLAAEFGQIDIYLFDQLLRGRITTGMRIVDAGCGGGRNLIYFFKNGFDIFGVDEDARAVASVRATAQQLAPDLPATNFRNEPVQGMSFPDACADVVLSSAVLHFAQDDEQFAAMVHEMWHVLKPDGLFFCRLASNIGMEARVQPVKGRRHLLPDGSERYLVDEKMLLDFTRDLGGRLVDPLKTTVVQDQRCMTTWVLRKNA
jgi:SAM-dependent methyltransferase